MTPWILFTIRILIGLLFIFVGVNKLLSPYQNFQYVIQHYQIFPSQFDALIAMIFPWIELFAGLFVLLGLWTRWSLTVLGLSVSCFIIIIVQALIRHLPIDDCGCFGGAFTLKPAQTLILDIVLWLLIAWLLRNLTAQRWSLDRLYGQ